MNETETAYTDALIALQLLMGKASQAHASHALNVFDESIDCMKRAYQCLTAVQEKRAELGLDD